VRSSQRGFSLAELMISMSIMLVIAGAASTALMKMTGAQATIWNRTQMHSGIRGATEVLQQEVGQAGRVSLPATVTLGEAVVTTPGTPVTVTVAVTAPALTALGLPVTSGMFLGEKLLIDAGCFDTTVTPCVSRQETVTLTTEPSSTQITASFTNPHGSGASISALGGFASGVVPPLASPVSFPNGSTGTVLKLYGDINADGNMVYVEYSCDIPPVAGGVQSPGNLYRNSMAWDAAAPSAAPTASQILLSNIMPNPDGSACFTYQTAGVMMGNPAVQVYFVTDVAITLTVQTQLIDPVTKQFQTETKALLNVSPRNVFNAWTVASLGLSERIQPMPPSITALLQ
jgi:prepilin-type N-terminal cleavage/methylation domain-containing protein